ncbi:hypothetical protein FISHEDRAFT_42019, partial [Fistulina hepatica ATCC 64428]
MTEPCSHVLLPEDLLWLKNANIQLLIDQEGFRWVAPSFRLAGFSASTRVLDPEGTLAGGCAQFMPMKRETYHFHYAPFDGTDPPMLRRVQVNGAENRDYIS